MTEHYLCFYTLSTLIWGGGGGGGVKTVGMQKEGLKDNYSHYFCYLLSEWSFLFQCHKGFTVRFLFLCIAVL